MTQIGSIGSTAPSPDALHGMDAESINLVLELLVAPLQAAVPQPTEVVLHDLQRIPNTVRAIAGDVTRRQIGDPPTDKLLERVAAGDFSHEIGYRSQLPDGRILQSTTIIYIDKEGRAAAALCLNADVSAWVTLRSALDRFVLGHDGSSMLAAPAVNRATSVGPQGANTSRTAWRNSAQSSSRRRSPRLGSRLSKCARNTKCRSWRSSNVVDSSS
ncbi:PAS domain-containing protein [Arthrobacter sp. SA17]